MCKFGLDLLRLFGSIVENSSDAPTDNNEEDGAEVESNNADTQTKEADAGAVADAASATAPSPLASDATSGESLASVSSLQASHRQHALAPGHCCALCAWIMYV